MSIQRKENARSSVFIFLKKKENKAFVFMQMNPYSIYLSKCKLLVCH